jgi:carboxypeptidase PM20D1
LEYILKNGFKPKRTFYLALGHDEEDLGFNGAQQMANLLQSRGVNDLEYLLDEGMVIFNQIIPGVDNLIAVVGVTEKGYLTLKLTSKGPVGHSSMAPLKTSIITLAKAVSKSVLYYKQLILFRLIRIESVIKG